VTRWKVEHVLPYELYELAYLLSTICFRIYELIGDFLYNLLSYCCQRFIVYLIHVLLCLAMSCRNLPFPSVNHNLFKPLNKLSFRIKHVYRYSGDHPVDETKGELASNAELKPTSSSLFSLSYFNQFHCTPLQGPHCATQIYLCRAFSRLLLIFKAGNLY
jgi:hypothetical protein